MASQSILSRSSRIYCGPVYKSLAVNMVSLCIQPSLNIIKATIVVSRCPCSRHCVVGTTIFLLGGLSPQSLVRIAQICYRMLYLGFKLFMTRTTQSQHQSHANCKYGSLSSKVGDRVFLGVSPLKGVMRFGRQGKLSSRYIGPFEILRQVGLVTYRLSLPPTY